VKIHTDVLTNGDVFRLVRDMPGLYVETTSHGSRSRLRRLDVGLWAYEFAPGRAGSSRPDSWHPTWAEWTALIEALYALDPLALIGQYVDRADFLARKDDVADSA
jgi:hypothetical protein